VSRDYARRANSAGGSGRRGLTHRRGQAARSPGFSWGSFVSGMVVGIAFTVTAALLPDWWAGGDGRLAVAAKHVPEPVPPQASITVQEPQFTFWDELPRDRAVRSRGTQPTASQAVPQAGVTADPASSAQRPNTEAAVEYLLQAGSFARNEQAERLRGSLLLLGMQADTVTVTLPGGTVRHRVLVGPFNDERSMRRAQTQLREQDIEPLPLRRVPGSP
jgi:hypothetical protein